jgi:hypothetical protein
MQVPTPPATHRYVLASRWVLASSARPCAPPTDCPADETNTTLSRTTSYRSSTAYWYRVDASAGVHMSYDSVLVRTGSELGGLLSRVNAATKLLQRSTTVPNEVRTRRWLSCSGFRSANFRAGSPRHEQSRSRSEVDSLRRHKPHDRLSANRGQAHERFCTAAQEGQLGCPLR